MKILITLAVSMCAACAPFGDVATPAAECVALMKRTFDKENSVSVKLITRSDLSDDLKKALIDGFKMDFDAYQDATKALLDYLAKLGTIKWDTTSLKALWDSTHVPGEVPNSIWNDPRVKELIGK